MAYRYAVFYMGIKCAPAGASTILMTLRNKIRFYRKNSFSFSICYNSLAEYPALGLGISTFPFREGC